eukprot:CAMPEP_0118686228 /NCGR_PEP_ID=MMETSP0800-20121206/7695_1 /TAXON_ID=210618 ORGANISM="Striatella unipunctata, Strain CCMP2910" /NCGR_SAMPLE_ID=MMETSP0800 /ASSEMBLY_ACC=CAM_ASM_000638 /LENGTH=368 /DNA_ID=CAMNT_0006583247 /DNA_START=128 /DNA_END=1234 /DNA_ORIENTATION=-
MPANILGWLVIKDGVVVAEGNKRGYDGTEINPVYSVTKTLVSMIIGHMVTNGRITALNQTLDDFFTNETMWEQVNDAEYKRSIALGDLLSMTSGLKEVPDAQYSTQDTLEEVLNQLEPAPELRGVFNYLIFNHILSRIIHEVTGLTPREYAKTSGVFDALGIGENDYTWDTFGGVEGSAYGFNSNPRTLAKIGQLFLQNGFSSNDQQLLDPSWIESSVSNRLSDPQLGGKGVFFGYGNLWLTDWIDNEGDDSAFADFEGGYSAAGYLGQVITVFPRLNVVVVIMATIDMDLPVVIADSSLTASLMSLSIIMRNLEDLDDIVDECPSNTFSRAWVATQEWFSAINFLNSFLAHNRLEAGVGYLIFGGNY